jgi:ligand-binding SRPBCC domain-containing protein
MPAFDFKFQVKAPVAKVLDFHADTLTLRTLTPAYVKIHEMEPLEEGSVSRFTVWFGPLPVRWAARHSDVGDNGFTDSHIDGPMVSWVHTHTFSPVGSERTQVTEHVVYEHQPLPRGLLTRVLFSKPAMYGLFAYRMIQTKRKVK